MSAFPVHASELSDAKDEKNTLSNQIIASQTAIQNYSFEQDNAQQEIQNINPEIEEIESTISSLEKELEKKNDKLNEFKDNYQEVQNTLNHVHEKIGSDVDLSVPSDSLSNIDMETLTEYNTTYTSDSILLDNQISFDQIESSIENLSNVVSTLENQIEVCNYDKISYESQIEEHQNKIDSCTQLITIEEQNISKCESEIEELDKKIEELSKKKQVNVNISSAEYTASVGSAHGNEIVNYALQFVGNPYKSGGTSLTNGADCSGFTQSVYKHFGISIPRTSGAQAGSGVTVSQSDIQPGDIVCYSGHVAIYIGDGQIVHASTERTGIKVGYMGYKPVKCIKRYY